MYQELIVMYQETCMVMYQEIIVMYKRYVWLCINSYVSRDMYHVKRYVSRVNSYVVMYQEMLIM